MKARKLERAVQLHELSELRKKNVGEYFVNFSRHHRPWLYELARRYKERSEFPVMPMTLLPSYYYSTQDKEIAVFAGILISDAETIGHTAFDKVTAFREMLGERPWEWFSERKFVGLSIGRNQNKRTGGVENWKIAKLMDRLWERIINSPEEILLNGIKPKFNYLAIGTLVDRISKGTHCSYFDVLTYLVEDCCVGDYNYKLRLLLQVLACSDGFSLGLWSIDTCELKCPLTKELRLFLQTWFPDYRRYGSVDDAIGLFGFERETDFLYACLGYKELQKRNPRGCKLYATKYTDWYECGIRKKPYQFREIIPDIPF